MVKHVNALQTTDTSHLVKKAGYDRKFSETEKEILDHNRCKYITTQDFNKLTADNFAARLSQENLARENDIADFIIKKDFEKIISVVLWKYFNRV